VVVAISRFEWMELLESIYGPAHPITIAQRRKLWQEGG
jgi:hypothetical protein